MLKKKEDLKPGIYKHYKGGEYEVIGIAHHSEASEDLVVYKALYESRSFNKGSLWVRPKKMFSEEVEVDGKKMPRFEFISEAIDEDKEKFEDNYKRALADYQNLLKQTAKEKSEFARYANQKLLYDLLPAYDNLKTANEQADGKSFESWQEGLKYVAKQFRDALENNGVTPIKTEGEPFDHNTMEAVQNEDTDDKDKDGQVAREIKAGYMLNGKVIVPARVIVYQFKVQSSK